MARLTGGISFTGSMGDISAYKMRGVDGIVLRQKGGPSKQQIKNSPVFELTRYNNEECKGRMQMVKQINLAMRGVRHLYDYNCSGDMAAVCQKIIQTDTVNKWGARSIQLSKASFLLEGFTINTYQPFDTVVKHPLEITMDAAAGAAAVGLPHLLPGLHISNPKQQPLYRLVFVLGTVPDILFDFSEKRYKPVTEVYHPPITVSTTWYTAGENCPAQVLQLQIPSYLQQEGQSLLLSGGIEYGQPKMGGHIQYTKYAGAAKVLKVV
jgi:hypothetical protein